MCSQLSATNLLFVGCGKPKKVGKHWYN